MNRSRFKIGFLIVSLCVCLPAGSSWAQSSLTQGINYNVVRNLEPMKDRPQTPDFTLPILVAEQVPPNASFWQKLSRWWRNGSGSPSGEKVSLKDFRGKIVFLNFWATWCVPCKEEMPTMERLYQQYKDRGLVMLAVNLKDSRKDALAFVKELKLTYPILFDPEGEAGLLYGAWGLPTTYIIGPKGEGLARIWGPATWDSPGAKELIANLLEGKR
jgi:thiol-disulfide isomerase/thioredoxin